MNASELLLPDGTPSGVWMCGHCHRLSDWNQAPPRLPDPKVPWKDDPAVLAKNSDYARGQAERCCPPCRACGVRVPGVGVTHCPAHRDEWWRQKQAADDAKAFAAAKERTDYPGPFVTGGDTVAETVVAAVEFLETEGQPVPPFLWVPRRVDLSLDAGEILERAVEDEHHPDAMDSFSPAAVEELQAFLDGWCGRNPVTSWWEEKKEFVVVPPELRTPGVESAGGLVTGIDPRD